MKAMTKLATMTATVLLLTGMVPGRSARLTAAGATNHPLRITFDASAGGILPDGAGAYVNGVGGVTATYTASTGTVTFANAQPNGGKTGRVVIVNLDNPVDPTDSHFGVFQVNLASWMKPIGTADGFYDMTAMKVGDRSLRKWNVQWPGSNNTIDTFHLHWDPPYFPSDATVAVTCVAQGGLGSGPCTKWEARPNGAAGLRNVSKISKNVVQWHDDGNYNVPFVMTIQQCDVAGAPCQ